MVWVTHEIFRKYISTKREKEAGMEPVTVTIVGTEVYYGLYPGLNPSVSDVMYYGVYNPEVFITPEELDIPNIDVTDVPPNVVYPEMLLRFHFYLMSSIM